MAAKRNVVGFAGPHGSGKSTAALLLASRLRASAVFSFADPIRDMLRAGLGLTDDDFTPARKDTPHVRYEKSPRQMLQSLGTEWGRGLVDPAIWVKHMAARIETSRAAVFIIPDVYTEAEAEFIRSRGALVHILGRGAFAGDHCTSGPLEYDRIRDATLDNRGEVADLENALVDALTTGPGVGVVRLKPRPSRPVVRCEARARSSGKFCDGCGLNWDLNDPEPPPCPRGGV